MLRQQSTCVAVVVGASCAVGREVTRRLAALPSMRLALVSRRPLPPSLLHPLQPPQQQQQQPSSSPQTLPASCVCCGFEADIAVRGACDALMRRVRGRLGDVALLVNCAGVNVNKLHIRCTDDEYDAVMHTNLRGALDLTRAALRHGGLLTQRHGSVVHIGSVVGCSGNAGQVLYAASKAALSGAVKAWAREYGDKGVRFNVVAPGLIDIPRHDDSDADADNNNNNDGGMAASLTAEQRAAWQARCPLRRLATPAEVADVVLSIAFADYINGQTIVVDGGAT